MATKADFQPLAGDVVAALGGPDNVSSFTHCATRLRFKLRDPERADLGRAGEIPGVLTAIAAGGQHQIVIGNDVPKAYAAVRAVAGMSGKATKDADTAVAGLTEGEQDKNFFNRFIDLISALFSPIIWALSGVAIGKAFLNMFGQFSWLDPASGTYAVLNAAFDGVFYFLPLFLALTAARRFRVNQFVALAVVTPLVHPAIVELAATEGSTAFGFTFPEMSYASSVIPAIVAVWLTGYVERACERALPGAVRNFGTPLICVLVMVPVVLLTIGPATMWLSFRISDGVGFLFQVAPWLAGAVMGGLWQVLVMFGLHWGIIPIFLNELATDGFTVTTAPVLAAVLAQASATAAVFFATRNPARKAVAGPSAISGLLAGVTEPAIYGVNLPLKIPFYVGLFGGAVGGVIIAMAGSAANSFVFPSLLALPAFTEHGSFTGLLIGCGAAIVIGFFGTLGFVRSAERRADISPLDPDSPSGGEQDNALFPADDVSTPVGTETATTRLLLPAAGTVVALADIDDKVFASGAMGQGIGVIAEGETIFSPVSGKIIAAPKSGHAYGIKTADGVEVLVHVGIDTVQMKGEGFTPRVAKGDLVEAGSPLVDVDWEAVGRHGYDPTTIMVVTNTSTLTSVTPVAASGPASAGAVGLDVEL